MSPSQSKRSIWNNAKWHEDFLCSQCPQPSHIATLYDTTLHRSKHSNQLQTHTPRTPAQTKAPLKAPMVAWPLCLTTTMPAHAFIWIQMFRPPTHLHDWYWRGQIQLGMSLVCNNKPLYQNCLGLPQWNEFMWIVHQWRYLKQLKQGGCGSQERQLHKFHQICWTVAMLEQASLMACGVVSVQHCKQAPLLCHLFLSIYVKVEQLHKLGCI